MAAPESADPPGPALLKARMAARGGRGQDGRMVGWLGKGARQQVRERLAALEGPVRVLYFHFTRQQPGGGCLARPSPCADT